MSRVLRHRVRLSVLSVLAPLAALPLAASADFEDVRILRTEPVQIQQPCPPGVAAQAPAAAAPPPAPAAPPPSGGITGQQVLGTVAGAAVGGLVGHQIGGGSGRTAATAVGAAAGGFAGYKLSEQKPPAVPPPQAQAGAQQPICLMTQYRVFYARQSGIQGDVVMTSQPTSQSLMINFCGDKPCM
jgi:hypothetical protein